MDNKAKPYNEDELIRRYLAKQKKDMAAAAAALKTDKPQGKTTKTEALSQLLQQADEIAGALIVLRDSMRQENAVLKEATERATRMLDIFEKQIELFTGVNEELLGTYSKELPEIARRYTQEVTTTLVNTTGKLVTKAIEEHAYREMRDLAYQADNLRMTLLETENRVKELTKNIGFAVFIAVVLSFGFIDILEAIGDFLRRIF